MATSSSPDEATLRRRIDAAASPLQLMAAFRDGIAPHGFTAYALGFIPDCAVEGGTGTDAREPFLLIDWPKAWLELYARQGFAADDVVVAEAARTATPFTWSEVRVRHPGASTRVFAAAKAFGWTDGFVVPVHLPDGAAGERFGVVSLAATHLTAFDAAARLRVVALARTAFAQARALAARDAGGLVLSARERETLLLVAEGLGDAGIGARLGISAATAHYHVERAKLRLGASTRAQAVAIALSRNLI